MKEVLKRIERCARRHPSCAIKLFAQLEVLANEAQQISVALDALARRFFIHERLGTGALLVNALFIGLQKAEANHLPFQAGRLMLCIGRMRYTQGGYQEAIHFWTHCIDLCKVTHDTEVLVEARIGLGQIYDALGDWETGASFHLDAGELLRKFDRPYLKSKQAINLAVNSIHIGQMARAKDLLDEAIRQAQRADIREYVAEAHWHLGVIAKQEKQFDLALTETAYAIKLAEKCDYQWLLGAAANTIGEIQMQKGDRNSAIQVYLDALAHAEKIESRPQRAHCSNMLSNLYEAAQDHVKALHYSRDHHRLMSEITNLSASDKFHELRDYDLTHKSPVELLLDLSSDSKLEEKSLSEALAHIAESALTILKIDSICLWTLDGDREPERLRCMLALGKLALPFKSGSIITQKNFLKYFQIIYHFHAPISTYDIRLHPAAEELSHLYENCELCSLLEISVRMHGKQIGILSFGKAKVQRNWTREDVLFASHVANLIQQVLAHEEHREAQNRLENRVAERTKELQHQTELLRAAHNNISMLSEIGREITSQLDREGIISTLYRHVSKLMSVDVFSIGIFRPDQALIEFPGDILNGNFRSPYAHDINDPDLLSVWCIKQEKEIHINDLREDYVHFIGTEGLEKVIPIMLEEDLGAQKRQIPLSLIYAPLIIKARVMGLISVQSAKTNAYQRVHVDMLTTLAAYTAVAFDNTDTYQQLSTAEQMLMSKEKLAALGALVAGIAHEINTPLGNCLLTATTLKDYTNNFVKQVEEGNLKRSGLKNFTDTLGEANEMLLRNLYTASDLISSFKQVSVDQTSQHRRRFNLLKTSQEIVRTMQGRIDKHGHHLKFEIAEFIEIDSYPGPYGQIISNFINNALVHAFEQRSNGEMILAAELIENDQIRIIFSDNGHGIKPEHLRRIFDPFFTTKLGQGGSGLGMNIVHNIVRDLLAGRIEVESQVGVGTQIILVLPISLPT
jgi:signal transduction histidine kinase/tetratricopeptide (TPR) repeat protein